MTDNKFMKNIHQTHYNSNATYMHCILAATSKTSFNVDIILNHVCTDKQMFSNNYNL